MSLKNDTELKNTKKKLAELQQLIDRAKATGGPGARTEVHSLSRLADEIKEEIARYEAGAAR